MSIRTRFRRALRGARLGSMVALTVVWVLLWGSVSWGTVAMGVFVAVVILVFFPLPRTRARIRVRPWGFVKLSAVFLRDLLVASVDVAWKAVRPRPIGRGRVLRVQLTETDDLRRTIVAELTSLVPGTIVIDLDPASGVMTVHVLDTCDDRRLAREVEEVHRLERRVQKAFGRSTPAGDQGADEQEVGA